MQKQSWKKNFILSLKEISDISRQCHAWILKKELLDSPSEIVCQLFDDSGVSDKLKNQNVSVFLSK